MKKGLALVLAAAMAAGTMTGCSGGGSTGKAAVGNTETADTAAEAAEGGETAQTEPVSYEVTEPIMAPFRKLLPPMSGVDFSPMILFLVISLVRSII